MTGRIFFANARHREEISALRKAEYARASGFIVDLETLNWGVSDDESFVMAAEFNGRIVATMRGEVINDQKVLERKLECPWSFPADLRLPALLLSRAATASEVREHGLNLVLRSWFIRFALHHKLPALIGTFVSGSPRERSLREMGYRMFENELGWQQSTYRSTRPVTVAVLDLATDGARAERYCREHAKPPFPFLLTEDFPPLRYVRNL